MIETDLDDAHLCIKCSSTIVGLENYIQHRKLGCSTVSTSAVAPKLTTTTESTSTSHDAATTIITSSRSSNIDHSYESFAFAEPEPPSSYASKSEHGGKTSKSLSDPYDLPYELGADVFFSSLQLQSVQSTAGPSTSGKTGSSQQHLQRQKSSAEHHEVAWIETGASCSAQHSTETLMKAVSAISDVKKPYEVIFKPLTFDHESPEVSEEEEEEVDVEVDEDDEEEFDPIAASHATGGKWKPSIMRHSPPVVPLSHTGGKWKPENRPNLRVTLSQLTRLSPNWEEPPEEAELLLGAEHPPAEHTKGKWVPGTKLQHLEFKNEVELNKFAQQDYWCNICCRKLKNKHIYENHLKTAYHLKRAEPEQQLEKATLGDMNKNFVLEEPKGITTSNLKKRKRRANFVKCELCKMSMLRHLLGKHLISHFHFRRMQLHPDKSLRMIIDNIHSIVLQAPFQCRPCSFYANTEETFLQHWNTAEHLDASEGQGKFWCSFCHFECEDNNQMRRHLLSSEHKEVLLAINRSVPISISKKLSLDCHKCRQSFRYNLQLRKHLERYHPEAVGTGTASDAYQSRFNCEQCTEVFRSKIALQRHEKHRHFISKYFCTICNLEFDTPCKARRHRKSIEHRLHAASAEKRFTLKSQRIVKKKSHTKVKLSTGACENCDFVASSEVEAMLHELSHPRIELHKNLHSVAEQNASSSCSSSNLNKDLIRVFKCKDCEESYDSRKDLKLHRDEAHPFLRHVCTICGESFAFAQQLGRHTRVCQPTTSIETTSSLTTEPVTTTKILETAASQDSIKDTTESNSWSCSACNFRASLKSELIFHQLHHTLGPIGKNQLINCPLCSKSFRKHSLRCHLRQHTDEKIFACDFCDMKFSRNHNLKNHIKVMHGTQEAATTSKAAKDVCSKNVKNVSGMQCDNIGEVDFKPFSFEQQEEQTKRRFACSFKKCCYTAANKTLLKIHLTSHSEQSFKCERENCSYVGKSAMHLKRHSLAHAEPRKIFNCDKCDFSSRISGHLKRHLRTHTGEKPHKCPHCDFSTALLDNLRKHILKTNKHPGKFIYECDACKTQEPETEQEKRKSAVEIFKTNALLEFQAHLAKAHTKF